MPLTLTRPQGMDGIQSPKQTLMRGLVFAFVMAHVCSLFACRLTHSLSRTPSANNVSPVFLARLLYSCTALVQQNRYVQYPKLQLRSRGHRHGMKSLHLFLFCLLECLVCVCVSEYSYRKIIQLIKVPDRMVRKGPSGDGDREGKITEGVGRKVPLGTNGKREGRKEKRWMRSGHRNDEHNLTKKEAMPFVMG